MQPIASSEIARHLLERRYLMPLSRRALYERKPVIVNSVLARDDSATDEDWELDWPTILYAPVGEIDQRPIGLLVVGCRRDHWYAEEDVAQSYTLGISLAPMVAALRGPLSRLNESETMVAQLLGHGFSPSEMARAMTIAEPRARMLVDSVMRKLRSVTDDDLRFPAIQLKRMTW
jgi:DNA-binding CsgD family transcriptional regulator